ncbi:ATP-binding protein [Clostridium estertheticum]|uniref:ATP-binding protein n=1 Tax=Clostridium estertheticum TaxID=238834 RepID=UPI001CF3B11F|nr:ATP-binding protein [Clostridium estertheticum]MCB2356021.1 cell wall metabolism sensor histidine kinase WalK [Clostridium estertheticum]WAG42150.1 cell wall metabolism sensor histidine kinase WalK [Clostridium estertheticum]
MFFIKTLKGKIVTINVFLVLVIVMIGLLSSFNIYRVGGKIDGLITNNYKSIDASTKMTEVIETQDKTILRYIAFENKSTIDIIYNNNEEFYKWLNVAKTNITEVGEANNTNKISEDYLLFVKSFSKFHEYQTSHTSQDNIKFYNSKIYPSVVKVKADLEILAKLNEKAMFKGRDNAKSNALNAMYFILLISSIAAIIGLIISLIFTNKSLKPIYLLTETIKSVKQGEINKQAPVINEDEIGMLAMEFNNMTNRLYEFEQSTTGKLLSERNKSIAIVKSITDPLIVLDASYKIQLLNESCENIFGVLEQNIISSHFLETIRNMELYDYIFCVVDNKVPIAEKIISLKVNDRTCFFNIIVTVVYDKENKINAIVVLLKNITEYKELEKVRTDFIATISHEFKTPLTSIMMGVGLILEKNLGDINQKQEELLDTIKEETEKLTDLVSDLLKLSKIQSDQAVYNIKAYSIAEIASDCVKNYETQARNIGISLYNSIEVDLPNVIVDKEKITWVLNNLVSNAIKYTDSGGKIIIGAVIAGEKMKVFVKDNGKGIPREYHEKIFEKFVKISAYDTEFLSSGIGLSIAKGIVEAHDGTIYCESEVDKGSNFIFTLPVEK